MNLDEKIKQQLCKAGYEHNRVRLAKNFSAEEPGKPGWHGRVVVELPIYNTLVTLRANIVVPRRQRSEPVVIMSMSPYASHITNGVKQALIDAMKEQRDE